MENENIVITRRPGGRLDAPPEERILDATVTEIARSGLSRLSVDRVAARAAVSKTTIYSRWRTKDDLVVAAFAAVSDIPRDFSQPGGLRETLRAMFDYGRERADDLRVRVMLAELHAAAQTDDAACAVIVEYRRRWEQATITSLQAASNHGDLSEKIDVEFLAEMIAAIMTYRTLAPGSDNPFTEDLWERMFGLVFETPPRLGPHAAQLAHS